MFTLSIWNKLPIQHPANASSRVVLHSSRGKSLCGVRYAPGVAQGKDGWSLAAAWPRLVFNVNRQP
jgi:hypothetical protein